MIYISDEVIDKLIGEDVPYCDLTTWALGIGQEPGKMQFFSREAAVLSGTEEVQRIFGKLGIRTVFSMPSGTVLKPDEVYLEAEGPAQALHMAWKVSQNLLESCSGIATKTRRIVEKVKAVNPAVSVVGTRKSFPGTKQLCVKAILHGGAFPHRLGLSETLLVFKQHMNFMGGLESFLEQVPHIKAKVPEKKLLVETESIEEGLQLCRAGVDSLQFDKLPPEVLRTGVARLKAVNPRIVLLAAGGIDEHNAAVYAETGVDALVTTSLYFAKSIDTSVRILPA